ncbi:uncharacterized protein LOC126619241 isoform X2 [Malus sylvestris]|uniref:uncharacterized protein LOC126619241 isoform X2 n=2 Tax=Malus sylvestris TaxID=3752 RepID=UPI0021ABC4AE|nr:uncharacterized protein LOC126619241 isoform X2 [Malus sylvestris]
MNVIAQTLQLTDKSGMPDMTWPRDEVLGGLRTTTTQYRRLEIVEDHIPDYQYHVLTDTTPREFDVDCIRWRIPASVALMSAVDEDGFRRMTYSGEDKGGACVSHVLLAATVMLLDFLCFKTVEDSDYCC